MKTLGSLYNSASLFWDKCENNFRFVLSTSFEMYFLKREEKETNQ
jgi:hypothetical protein